MLALTEQNHLMITDLHRKAVINEHVVTKPDALPNFPIKEMDAFENFDKIIDKEENVERIYMVCFCLQLCLQYNIIVF